MGYVGADGTFTNFHSLKKMGGTFRLSTIPLGSEACRAHSPKGAASGAAYFVVMLGVVRFSPAEK